MNPLQEKLIDLLEEVDQICRENGIVYYLHAGNALGAVRHRGFIPWDDDIDIIVTRENWEKFHKAFHSKKRVNRTLVCPEDNPEHFYLFARYVDTKTSYAFRWKGFNTGAEGVAIDFVIFDPVSGDVELQRKYRKWMILYSELVGRRLLVNPDGDLRTYQMLKLLGKVIGEKPVLKFAKKKMDQYMVKDGPRSIQVAPHQGLSWTCSSEFFQEPEDVNVEGHMFYAPTNPRGFVRAVYGDDWMCLPPPENRRSHPFVGSLTVGDGEAEKDARRWVDPKKYDECYVKQKPYVVRAAFHENKRFRIDARMRCQAYALELQEKLNRAGLDLEALLAENRYTELLDLFSNYLSQQMSEYRKMDITTNVLTAEYTGAYVIHIPHDVLNIVCMVLTMTGDFPKAQKILDMNFGQGGVRPKEFETVQTLIDVNRELSVAYYDDRDWYKIRTLVAEWLPRYPHHVDFVYLSLHDTLRKTKSKKVAQQVLERVEEELKIHPDSALLQRVRADALLRAERREQAVEEYRAILRTSCNGIINLDVSDTLRKLRVSEQSEAPVPVKKPEPNARNLEIQKKLGNLLREFDEVCTREGIPYFLGPALTRDAVNKGVMSQDCYANQIVMRPCDRERLVQALQKDLRPNRLVDCFETNGRYANFSVRYCDTTSIFFDRRDGGLYQGNSICVEVLFVVPDSGKKWIRRKNSFLTAAVEGAAVPSAFFNTHAKKVVAGLMGRALMLLLGKKGAKRMLWKQIYAPRSNADVLRGRIKSYHSSWCELPPLNFAKRRTAYLDNHPFAVPENYVAYVTNMKKTPQAPNTVNLNRAVQIIAVPHADESAFLAGMNRDIRLRAKYESKVNRLHEKSGRYAPYIIQSWNYAQRSLARLEMMRKYMPQKKMIMNLYHAQKYARLERLLSDYINVIELYAKKNMAVYFDADIYMVTWHLMQRKGKGEIMERMQTKIPAAHRAAAQKKPVVSGLKQVRLKEQLDSILNYLRPDQSNCLYLYVDLYVYGLGNPNMQVWYDSDKQGIRMVVMQYHKSFQVYANRAFTNVNGLLPLIKKQQPHCISARSEIIEALEQKLPQYKVEYGVVMKHPDTPEEKLQRILANREDEVQIMQATTDDVYEIAQLVCSDEELGAPYTVESLAAELRERIETGMGRSFIIRDGERIVAHTATYAEADDFAVAGGLIVHPDYRDTDYFHLLDTYSQHTLTVEQKSVYGMVLDRRLARAFERTGCTIAANYGKLSLIEKPEEQS